MRKLQIFILLFGIFIAIQAQDGGTSSNVPKTIDMFPKGPEAAALSKFVDIPSGNFTGVADFSIPLYTIEFDGQQIPISLRYSTTGIKVDQIATRVGLGWVLDAGPSLSQQVIGELDQNEKPNFGPYFSPNNMINQQDPVYQFALNAAGIGSQHIELEPDIFTYNLLNKSGKYILNRQGTKGIPIPYNQTDITASNYRTQMDLVDEQGFKYIFNSYADYEIKNKNTCASLGEFTFNNPNFKIQKIVSPKNETINFLYSSFIANSKYITSVQTQVAYMYDPGDGQIPAYPPTGPTANTKCINYAESKEAALSEIQFKGGKIQFTYSNKTTEPRLDLPGDVYLKQIKVINDKGQTIKDFSLIYDYFSSTEPLPTTTTAGFLYLADYIAGMNYRLKLKSVVDSLAFNKYELEYNESSALPIRTSNNQDFWGVYNGANNGIKAVSSQPSEVAYYSGGTKFLGANKKSNIKYGILGNLRKIIYPTGGYTTIEYEADEYDISDDPEIIFTTIETDIDPIYGNDPAKEFIIPPRAYNNALEFSSMVLLPNPCTWELKNAAGVRIAGGAAPNTYYRNDPPGKYYLKLYKSNDASCSVNYSYSITETVPIDTIYTKNTGTIRVGKVESFDQNNGKITREFTYRVPTANFILPYKRSSGMIHGDINFSNLSVRSSPSPSVTPGQVATETYLVNNPGWQTATLNGKSTGYTYVQEYYKDETYPENSYRKEYEFNNTTEYDITYGEDNGTSVTWSPGNMENGLLKRETLFNSNNQKIKETFKSYKVDDHFNYKYGNSTYNQLGMEMGYGLKIYPIAKRGYMYDFNYSVYQLKNKWIREDSTIVRDYSNGTNYIETIHTNNYSIPAYSHTYPKETISVGSGNIMKTTFGYPQDVTAAELGNDQTQGVLNTMIAKNQLADPVIVKSYKNGLVNSEIKTLYEQYDTAFPAVKMVLPRYIYAKKGENSAAEDRKITFDSYDDKGNLTQYTLENGIPVSVIWGYNKTKPIAKIEGAKLSAVLSWLIDNIVNKSNADNNYSPSVSADQTEQDLIDALDSFKRHSSLAEFQVTTYTYDPLFGVRSVTPPSGLREYYTYDDVGRLKEVKRAERDSSGNEVLRVLKKNEYHYQQP